MSHQITVQPGGYQFSAEAGESLLDAALRQGFSLPYGCRDGACGACKGKVLCGEVAHGKAADSALPAAERAAGQALFCCATALSDLVLEARQMTSARDFPVKTLPARIESMQRAAEDVMVIKLRLPASEKLEFHAGQYVDILLKDGRKRSFSMANAPGAADGLLELHVRHVPGGVFTDQVFSTMKARDIMRINGPLGGFYLRESSQPAILLAGGTGFAPIKSMVEAALARGEKRPLHVYWGARARPDLYMDEVAAAWVPAGVNYVPVLSEPQAADAWSGRSGWVHQAVLADFPEMSRVQVYACGSPAMIDAARRDFAAAGLPDDAFYADAFTFAT